MTLGHEDAKTDFCRVDSRCDEATVISVAAASYHGDAILDARDADSDRRGTDPDSLTPGSEVVAAGSDHNDTDRDSCEPTSEAGDAGSC
jgi:hypothetical protein